ncbi:metallophosphoesterase [Natronosalvus vescus]|uniref:metallophosphoesterase n=1 Tax=Natronosalvus vescus TaxID=2953881 RepID=UPI0020911FA5|nr:metallophosphoesterase [Natronosalvus vescus]
MTDGEGDESRSIDDTTFAVDVPIEFLERAVYVPAAETLVVADLHLGRAAASAVDAPIDDGGDVLARLETLLAQTAPTTVVVAGDLLHAFSSVPEGVDWDVTRLERAVADADADLVVTPGNHDSMLETVYAGQTAECYRLADGETVVCHGHERPVLEGDDDPEPQPQPRRYIVGHDHPALSIGGRKLPCFLYGENVYRGADVLMLPAFTRSAAGATVNNHRVRDFQSPLIRDADAMAPGVRDESSASVLWFPPLGKSRRLL